MKNELLNYIDACKINIANYTLMEDEDERERDEQRRAARDE